MKLSQLFAVALYSSQLTLQYVMPMPEPDPGVNPTARIENTMKKQAQA